MRGGKQQAVAAGAQAGGCGRRCPRCTALKPAAGGVRSSSAADDDGFIWVLPSEDY